MLKLRLGRLGRLDDLNSLRSAAKTSRPAPAKALICYADLHLAAAQPETNKLTEQIILIMIIVA